MGLMDALRNLLALPQMHELSYDPLLPIEQQVADVIARRPASPYTVPTVRQALGVPAIQRAVTLIANTTGRLTMEAWRNGEKMAPGDAPRVVSRPNPLTTARVFYRDSAYYLASRGECWWWIAKRDGDGSALSLVVVPPWEIEVVPNPADRLRPGLRWQGAEFSRDDFRQLTYLPDDDDLYRGVGPLQLCGAALSVAVEAQAWAANFFAGASSTVDIYSQVDLDETEAYNLKLQWLEGNGNLPRIIPPTIEKVQDDSPDPAKAQMTETRVYSNGDAARMFGMPGALLEYAQSGTSLTYQNEGSVWREFQEGCLSPNYLEPIEQAMSDLLTRSTTSAFNLSSLLRSDPKTRADIYNTLIPIGVMTAEEARAAEGWAPGNVEYAPVPYAAPAAMPDALPGASPIPLSSRGGPRAVHCHSCDRMIGRLVAPYEVVCPRCKTLNAA